MGKLKTTTNMDNMKKVTPIFAIKQYGKGVIGMNLNLNLAQCEVLSNVHHSLNSPHGLTENEATDILYSLAPFFKLFSDFPSKNDPNLWKNGEVIEVSTPDEGSFDI